jgi:hypothetical protein
VESAALFQAAYDEHARRLARLYQNIGQESPEDEWLPRSASNASRP